ncbi:unnamed protein product [Euphydryas editha]|uniref:Gag protein n=1 Tax=Euphydryas editha TaxID=104508 RepID=A0AAU9TN63_EUPED|nr:unnamed protein product [Euphydryas editha]
MSFENCDSSSFKLISEFMPRYDGNPRLLNYYIREVENILNLLDNSVRGHPAILCLIKSRLSGVAIDAIAYEDSLPSWEAIRAVLIQRLREPRNEIQVMQELSRMRRNRNEDAESFGRRLRDILDTLFSVGTHSNKAYYESMVIEQYTNNLDFQVSIGVRIAQPITLESAIVIARQEEAKLAYSRTNNYNNFSAPSTSQAKVKEPIKSFNQFPNHTPFKFNNQVPRHNNPGNVLNTNFVPQKNNLTPEQRQQWVQSMLPWKNRPSASNYRPSSGNFRNNLPQQQVSYPQKVSDVSMRSISKPAKPQFAVEELFYADEPSSYEQFCDDGAEQGQYEHFDNFEPNQHEYQSPSEEIYTQQDFSPHPNQNDSS